MNNNSPLASQADILLVEDNRVELRFLDAILSEQGYKVRTAVSGELALNMVEVAKPDLILLETNLSDLNGYKICETLKANRHNADIPVIFISALDEELDRVKVFEVGGIDCVRKPIKGREVLAIVKNHLRLSLQQKQLIEQQKQLTAQNAQLQRLLTIRKAIDGSDGYPPEVADFILNQAVPAAMTDGVWSGEALKRGNGEVVPVSQVIIAHKSDSGDVEYVSTIARDLSDRKQVEAKLLRISKAVESVSDAIGMSDATGQSVYHNPAWNNLFGYTDAELKAAGGPPTIYADPEIARAVFETIKRGDSWQGEVQMRTKSDRLLQIRLHADAIKDSAGQIIGLVGIHTDITERKQAEEALRESEERFRQLAEHLHQVFWMISRDRHQMLYVSPAYEEIWQRSCQSLYEQPSNWFAAIHPDDRERVLASLQQIPHQNDNQEEYRILRPDGSIRWIGSCAFPIKNERGEVYRIAGISEDITERKQAEAARRESEEKFRNLVEQSNDWVWEVDENAIYTYASPRIRDLLGYEPEDVLGKTPFDLMPEAEARQIAEVFGFIAAARQPFTLENINIHKDKQLVILETSGVPIFDANGNYRGYRGIDRDVTERKQAEQRLRETTDLYQQILDTIPDFVLCKGAQSSIVYANKAFRNYYGMTMEQLQAVIDGPFVKPEYTQQYMEDDAYVFDTGETLNVEEPIVRYDGEERLFSTVKSAIFNAQGQVIQTVGVSRDITERKLAEAALQELTQQEREKALQLEQALKELQRTQSQLVQTEKMASLGQLVAGVAHEINNPTSFIYGNIDPANEYAQTLLHLLKLYQRHYPEPAVEITEQLKRLDTEFIAQDFPKLLMSMKEGANRIYQIVLSLRNFSRLDEAECKQVDIHQGIENTLLILGHRVKQHAGGCEIQVVKAYCELPLVECYPGPLNQVFMNILSNAIDALEELKVADSQNNSQPATRSTPWIQISTEKDERDWVVIRIANNGPGLTADVQQRMFDPFYTTKPPGKGTGLGLSISYRIIVDKHKGQIKCHSTPEGVEFVIELPLNQSKTSN